MNLYAPIIAREVPMKIKRTGGFSATNAFELAQANQCRSRAIEIHLAHGQLLGLRTPQARKANLLKLNIQTPSAFAEATARQVPASWRCPR